ncbi:MAG: S8 family serine peptidase [Micrococcales bacterium]|nr:S8 family serine peptidase [Micrococcales bacterium]
MVRAARHAALVGACALLAALTAPASAENGDAARIVGDLGAGEAGRVVTVMKTGSGGLDIAVEPVSGRRDALAEVAAGLADPAVRSVEMDAPVSAAQDPNVSDQWGVMSVQAPAAWLATRGAGVTVAVVDTGVDAGHEDLAGQVLPGVDLMGRRTSAESSDLNGHGTHVAAIIAAADNGAGGVGVAPQARILPIRVLDADGAGYAGDVAEGIVWAVDHGAQVINLSLGGPVPSQAQAAAVEYAGEHGVAIVVAAGNSGPGAVPDYPAAFEGVTAVAAATPQKAVASFSSRGTYVDLAAPGTMILSALPGNHYAHQSGSSMAAPFVAGVAALLYALDPDLDVAGVLTSTATDIDVPGPDVASGAGLVCALCAVEAVVGPVIQPAQVQPGPETSPVSAPVSWGAVRVRAARGDRVVLRAPRVFSRCTWSKRRSAQAWREVESQHCQVRLGRVRRGMDGLRYKVVAVARGLPAYSVVRLVVRG